MEEMIATLTNLISENLAAVITAIVTLLGPWLLSFSRRPTTVSQGEAKYFTDAQLLTRPKERPAYSDRMAYVLAEMSSLAYVRFEGSAEKLESASKELIDKKLNTPEEAKDWLNQFADDLLISGVDSRGFLEKILGRAGFELADVIDIAGTQAFVCKHTSDSDPYLVLAYRGTEQRIDDWLTDASAKPNVQGVHTGFWDALHVKTKEGVTVLQAVEKVLAQAGMEGGRPTGRTVVYHRPLTRRCACASDNQKARTRHQWRLLHLWRTAHRKLRVLRGNKNAGVPCGQLCRHCAPRATRRTVGTSGQSVAGAQMANGMVSDTVRFLCVDRTQV